VGKVGTRSRTAPKKSGKAVFIAWSGKRSRSHQIAKILKERIPQILQGVDVFFSKDIAPGKAWMEELRRALKQSCLGVLCVTEENKNSPWLHFEAGALWKAEQENRACVLLCDPEGFQLHGPLSQLQAIELDKEEMRDLLKSINDVANRTGLDDLSFERAFETGWMDIESDLRKVPAALTELLSNSKTNAARRRRRRRRRRAKLASETQKEIHNESNIKTKQSESSL
jgi:TIR domain